MAAIVGKGYSMHVWQYGVEQQSFAQVTYSNQPFTVEWFYTPDQYEQAAGARSRQVISETFKGGTGFAKVVGAMRKLREANLLSRRFVNTPQLRSFLGIP